MSRTALASLSLVAAAGLALPAASAPQPAYDWEIVELAPGVHAALQPADSRFDDSNSVFVIGRDGVLVVDAQTNPSAVGALQERIGTLTEAPVRMLVNTHWHGDHTMSNGLYRHRYGAELTIVGHASLLQDIPGRAAAQIEEQMEYFQQELGPARERLAAGVDREGNSMDEELRALAAEQIEAAEEWIARHADVRFEAPDLAYRSALLSSRLGRPIELVHAPGHTRGDTVLWLPQEKVLIAGDLVDAMPFVGHGAPGLWAASLRALLELDFETVVPGHGPLYGRERVEMLAAFMEDLAAKAATAVGAGESLEQALESIDIADWRDRLAEDEAAAEFFDQVSGEAIRAAWEEARAASGAGR